MQPITVCLSINCFFLKDTSLPPFSPHFLRIKAYFKKQDSPFRSLENPHYGKKFKNEEFWSTLINIFVQCQGQPPERFLCRKSEKDEVLTGQEDQGSCRETWVQPEGDRSSTWIALFYHQQTGER
jgi:hypothetical protein